MRAKDAVEQVLMPQCEQDYRAFHRTGRDTCWQPAAADRRKNRLSRVKRLTPVARLTSAAYKWGARQDRMCSSRKTTLCARKKVQNVKKWGPGEQNRFRREKFIVSRLLSRLSEAGRRCSVAGTEPTSRCLQRRRRRLNLKWAILAKIEFWEWKVA